MVGKRSFAPKNDRSKGSYKKSDIETGNRNGNGSARARLNMFRFRDAVNGTIGDNRRDGLKKALLDNIDIEGLEKWRIGDDEVCVDISSYVLLSSRGIGKIKHSRLCKRDWC
jgi:hypothetical protein